VANVKTTLSIKFKDALGVPSTVFLYGEVPDTKTIAELATSWGAGITAVAGVTNAGFVDAQAEVAVGSLVPITPAGTSESERGLLLNYEQADSIYKSPLWVPSVNPALIVGGKVNVSDAAIIALNAFLLSGSGGLFPTSKYLNVLTGLADAAESFRKLRRLADKRTKVVE